MNRTPTDLYIYRPVNHCPKGKKREQKNTPKASGKKKKKGKSIHLIVYIHVTLKFVS